MAQTQTSIHRAGELHDFTVFCPVETAHLSILRHFVTSVAEDMGFEIDDLIKIEMAVDEACSNIVLHAYDAVDGEEGGGIELKLSRDAESLTIDVRDRGKGATNCGFAGVGTIEEYRRLGRDEYHGLGLLIMKQFMDEVHFQAGPDSGTRVTLRKYIGATRRGERRIPRTAPAEKTSTERERA